MFLIVFANPSFLEFSDDVSGNNSFAISVAFDFDGVMTECEVDITFFVEE